MLKRAVVVGVIAATIVAIGSAYLESRSQIISPPEVQLDRKAF